jgi:transcriptional regulator of NAD metabolism
MKALGVISAGDVHRPIGAIDDREYELPEFSREYLNGRFEYQEIAEPAWWIVKRNARIRAPNFDLISTATVCGIPGVLLVEAKAPRVKGQTQH